MLNAPDAPLHALYHRNRFLAPRVRALLEFLTERFAQTAGELNALVPCTDDAVPGAQRRNAPRAARGPDRRPNRVGA